VSRYLVSKFLMQVDQNEALLKRYASDPRTTVADWEARLLSHVAEVVETSTVHHFTDEERTALEEQDYERLYAMGVHPLLLWTLMYPVLEPRFASFRDMVESYKETIRPYGYPDFSASSEAWAPDGRGRH
jgi:hypothetical protein